MLSDIVKPRISELGKIKIGGLGEERKARGGGTFRLPVKHDHFTVTTMQRDAKRNLIVDEDLMKSLVEEGYADADGKVRRLPVSCLSNDPEEVMQTAYVAYEGKKLAAKSDGKEAEFFYDFKKKQWRDAPFITEWTDELADMTVGTGNDARPMFKMHTTLNVVIASRRARWGGYYKFRTTSEISASQLYGSMIFLKENITYGLLRGVPLQLVIRPIQVNPEGQTTTVYVVHLEARGDDMEAIRTQALQRAEYELKNALQVGKAHRQYLALMRSPADFDEEEAEEVAQEFHPQPALESAAETRASSTSSLTERLAAGMVEGAATAAGSGGSPPPPSPPGPPPSGVHEKDDGINEPPGLFKDRESETIRH